MKIPELTLYQYLEALTIMMIEDLKSASTKEETILFHVLGMEEFKGDSYFDFAKELFLRSNEHPRKIQLNYSFAMERADLPSLSLSTPSETPETSLNSIGLGEDQDFIIKKGPDGSEKSYSIISRSYKASINIVISSSNFVEQTIIFHVYRDLLSSIFPQMNINGFINPSISGREVQINPALIPTNIYVRTMTLDFMYTKKMLSTVGREIITRFCEGEPKQIVLDPSKFYK